MKIKLAIDNINYSIKPQGKEIGALVNRMTLDQVKEYSIEELKQSILDGRTNRPSNCGKGEDSWLSQQIFMIDIDNKPAKPKGMKDTEYQKLCIEYLNTKYNTYNDIIKHCQQINLIPNFAYTSFNHKEDHHKFRLVFILNKEIVNINIAKKIQLYLMNSIGEVDEQCKNLNRPYFAGKEIVFDSGNILDSYKIIELSKDINLDVKIPIISSNKVIIGEQRKRVLNNNEIINIPILFSTPKLKTLEVDNYTIKAISNRDIKYLKGKYGNYKKIIFETKQEFIDYIRKEINLGELLEFHYPKSIRCIFHDDSNNSASIFQSTDDSAWLYKCFGCGVTYNIIGVIERLAGFQSRPNTYKFIKEIFNLEIMDTEWQKVQKEILQENLDILYSDMQFQEICPQTNKNINRIKHYLDRLINIAMKNVHNEELTDENGQVVFFASADYICKEMGISPNSLNKVYQKIAVFTYHKLLNKVDDENLPERFKKRSQAININYNKDNFNDNNKLKHVNFFSIPSYNVNRFDEIEQRAIQWKENHYTMKGVSREMFFRGEGLEIANEIYPQYNKVTEDINGKKYTIDRTTTKFSDDRVNNIVNAIFDLIDEYGYATEKKLFKS